MCPSKNIPPPMPASAATPAFDSVTACDTVEGLVGTCSSIAVSLASRPAPTKAKGTVHCHLAVVIRNGVDQKVFWSMNRSRGSDLRSTGGSEKSYESLCVSGTVVEGASAGVWAETLKQPATKEPATKERQTNSLGSSNHDLSVPFMSAT